MNEQNIEELVSRVMERLSDQSLSSLSSKNPTQSSSPPQAMPRDAVDIPRGTLGVFETPDQAVAAALDGFEKNEAAPLVLREKMIQAMRDVTRTHLEDLARYAHIESGLGRIEDKIEKNRLVLEKTPGTEILQPIAYTGDDGLTLIERAPYGVFLAVTPCTNPTETILCNSIGMIAGGNSVIFNTHPSAAKTCNWYISLLNEAIASVGGPHHVIVSIASPTIETAQALMKHKDVRLVVVTGGPGVVRQAMQSGKKVIAAGPGNPPALVDATADIAHAAKSIVQGASIDNNIICTAEKEIVAQSSIANALKEQLGKHQALILSSKQTRDLERLLLNDDGSVNRSWVGKNASDIAANIGITGHDLKLRLLVCAVEEAHPFVQHELLMPVIGMFEVSDITEGIAASLRCEHQFYHTAVMHSTNVDHMSAMARLCNCSIFVKNAPNLAGLGYGGEGYTSFTIASPTGEGLTTALDFTRQRRCSLKDSFRFV